MQGILVKFTMLDLANNGFIGLAEELITSRMKAGTYESMNICNPNPLVSKTNSAQRCWTKF